MELELYRPAATADNTGVVIGTGIAIIVTIAIGVLLILRKKQ